MGRLLHAAAVVQVLFLIPLRGRNVDCVLTKKAGQSWLDGVTLCLARRLISNYVSTERRAYVNCWPGLSSGSESFRLLPENSTAAAAGMGSPPIGQSLLWKGYPPRLLPRRAEGAFMHPLRGGCVHKPVLLSTQHEVMISLMGALKPMETIAAYKQGHTWQLQAYFRTKNALDIIKGNT